MTGGCFLGLTSQIGKHEKSPARINIEIFARLSGKVYLCKKIDY